MALVYFHALLFLSHLTLSLSSSPLFLSLTKHPSTHQHLTRIFHSSQLTPTTLLLDLNSPFLWLGMNSNTHVPIPRRSIQCSAATPDQSQSGPSDERCTVQLKNPVTGETAAGELVQDVVSVNNGVISAIDEFLYGSAPSILLAGLGSSSVRGVLGLGRNRVGVVEQVSHSFGFPKKFSLCLSNNSNGMVLFGENHQFEAFKSMIYTPILPGHGDLSYNINLSALKVQNKKLNLDQLSTVQISTVAPYTLMDSKVYESFIKAFAAAAETKNMVRVPPVGRFEVCYGVQGGETVPVIDLVLQSEMVKWRIHGHNSMVKVIDEVMCLGFLNGGFDLGASIVLGSNLLEDNLLEFDLGSSMLGFSSSLIMKQTSCSVLSSSALHKDDVQSL